MIKRLLISILVGVIFLIVTQYSFFASYEFGKEPVMFKVVNWSFPFWEYLYSDELLCTMSGYRKVEQGSSLTNGILTGGITYLILWLRARKSKLKLQ